MDISRPITSICRPICSKPSRRGICNYSYSPRVVSRMFSYGRHKPGSLIIFFHPGKTGWKLINLWPIRFRKQRPILRARARLGPLPADPPPKETVGTRLIPCVIQWLTSVNRVHASKFTAERRGYRRRTSRYLGIEEMFPESTSCESSRSRFCPLLRCLSQSNFPWVIFFSLHLKMPKIIDIP